MVRRGCVLLALALALLPCAADAASPTGTSTDRLIEFHQRRVTRDPEDVLAYNRLGAAYLQKARESGDVAYYDLAEKALRQSLTLAAAGPTATAATTSLALVHLARHQFPEALVLARQAVALAGDDSMPYAVLGDANLELGDTDEAARAYGKLLAIGGPREPHARFAELAFLRGDRAGAIDRMRRAVTAAREAGAPAENVAWTQVRLADLHLHGGDLASAEGACRDALGSFPGYHRGLAMLARVRAGQRRLTDAIDLYRKALAVIPLPEYAAALGDVYAKLGRSQDARKQYDLVEYIGALNRVNKAIYNRELALFHADHDRRPAEAVQLAEKELEIRQDVYTWDVVAWARLKNRQLPEAREAITRALALGTQDARLFFHAGMIHHALGEAAQARAYLERALATNPYFHVLQADTAAATLKQLDGAGR